jgi:TP901 family phage tail tape measure protein
VSDDVRKISVQLEATNATRGLLSLANNLDAIGNLTGKTDRQLRSIGGTLDRSAETARRAARAISDLKTQNRAMESSVAAAERQVEKSRKSQEKATQANIEARETIKALRAETARLRTENNALISKVNLLEESLQSGASQFKAYKQTVESADAGLARFGASAVTTMSRLQQLEVQMDAITGKQLSGLSLPTSLGGGSAASFIKNPDVQALQKLDTGALSQISQAYALSQRTLQQEVDRELTNRLGASLGFSADKLEFSNALRYQLYDVAGLFGVAGAAATALSVAFVNVGVQWEKNFANVVRTSQVTGAGIESLKNDFLDLQSTIPITSAQLAEIGTLGAQMGVAASNLANFTEVTARFSAVSGLSVDEAATSLSRLDELLPDVAGNYERLSSAILKTGVNAVATEQQIVRGVSQIASMGQIAGLTTPEVVALASAMSSVGFSPELQRSIITSSFSRILTATTQVTAQTEKFGDVLGVTGAAFQAAWREDALGTYRNLLQEIAGRSDAVSVLQGLGLASQRLTPNLLKLGQNVNVLDEALGDTTQGWREQSELSRQYGIIADTVAARVQVLSQSWEALLVTLNESDTIIKPLIEGLTGIVRGMREIAKIPGASNLVTVAAVFGTIAGLGALTAAALALGTAGYIAMVNATIGLNTVLATKTALTAADTAATNANTAAVAANAAANTVNSGALNKVGDGAILASTRLLTALPTILRATTLIGAASLVVTGLALAFNASGDAIYDWQKTLEGIDTPDEVLGYDVEKIVAADKAVTDFAETLASLDRSGASVAEDPSAGVAAYNAGGSREIAVQDLTELILSLETVEQKYAALNDVSRMMGISQGEVLLLLDDVASALGDGAEAASIQQEEVEQLTTATELWAAALGKTETELGNLKDSIGSAAGAFFDFGAALDAGYGDEGTGLTGFLSTLDQQAVDFEAFIASLGTLVQRGGTNLATAFAGEGPAAMQALTDSLALSDSQLAQIEEQMTLAAFYASEEFANIFAGNNALLALVFQGTGGNQAAVAEFSKLLSSTIYGASVDPQALAALEAKYGVKIPVDFLPTVDEDAYINAMLNAQAAATARPITLPVRPTLFSLSTDGPTPLLDEVQRWVVEEDGNRIVLTVDPSTKEGEEVLNAWRENQYEVPLEFKLRVDTSEATRHLTALRSGLTVNTQPRPRYATGGPIALEPKSLPAFATGGMYGQFRGPGSGTSDSILARVSDGEYINTAAAVRYYGTELFDDLNRMRVPRFAQGGPVSGSSGGAGNQVNVSVVQNYPQTVDTLDKLREDSEMLVAGLWS